MTALVERHGVAAAAARGPRFSAMVVVGNTFVRETLVRSLQSLGAREVAQAGSLAEARAWVGGHPPRDLCVVDVHLPDGSGVALFHELRTLGWGRGLVLSSAEDPYTVRAALTAGVRAFLVSPAAATALRAAPAERSGGQLPVQRPRPVRTAGPEGLSGREIEVLQLVADGQSNKGIGGALGLSALTVKSHLARIARKLGTGDRAEMVVVAMRAGVVV